MYLSSWKPGLKPSVMIGGFITEELGPWDQFIYKYFGFRPFNAIWLMLYINYYVCHRRYIIVSVESLFKLHTLDPPSWTVTTAKLFYYVRSIVMVSPHVFYVSDNACRREVVYECASKY
jgi:hypothetical protein